MISLSTELDYSPGSAQYAFLTKDLQAVNRTNTPWLVANFHRPYVSASVSVRALCTLKSVCQLMPVPTSCVYNSERCAVRLPVLTLGFEFAHLMHDLEHGPWSKGAGKSCCSVLACTARHMPVNLCNLCFPDLTAPCVFKSQRVLFSLFFLFFFFLPSLKGISATAT